MNGRAYDYNLGRFLSIDPLIQGPENSQSLNPYSYILNNPLSGTDPTGYARQCEAGASGRRKVGGSCAGEGGVVFVGGIKHEKDEEGKENGSTPSLNWSSAFGIGSFSDLDKNIPLDSQRLEGEELCAEMDFSCLERRKSKRLHRPGKAKVNDVQEDIEVAVDVADKVAVTARDAVVGGGAGGVLFRGAKTTNSARKTKNVAGKWDTPEGWAKHDHDELRDRLRKEFSGYESGRHNEYPRAMRRELNRLADEADARGDLPEYGRRMREMAETYQKREGAAHRGGR